MFLSDETILKLADVAIVSDRRRVAPPTPKSVKHLLDVLKLKVPKDYIDFSLSFPRYGEILCGIGEDYDHPYHILTINHEFHTVCEDGFLPDNLIVFNDGHDGDCMCFDLNSQKGRVESLVCYWDYENSVGGEIIEHHNFRWYLQTVIMSMAKSRNPGLTEMITKG